MAITESNFPGGPTKPKPYVPGDAKIMVDNIRKTEALEEKQVVSVETVLEEAKLVAEKVYHQNVETFAQLYLQATGLKPEEAVMFYQCQIIADEQTIRVWFEKKPDDDVGKARSRLTDMHISTK